MKAKLIRVACEFKKLIDWIRAKELLINSKEISSQELTRVLIKYLDQEKIWQDEFNKK
jgi:hypothetical protein